MVTLVCYFVFTVRSPLFATLLMSQFVCILMLCLFAFLLLKSVVLVRTDLDLIQKTNTYHTRVSPSN